MGCGTYPANGERIHDRSRGGSCLSEEEGLGIQEEHGSCRSLRLARRLQAGRKALLSSPKSTNFTNGHLEMTRIWQGDKHETLGQVMAGLRLLGSNAVF